MADPRFAIDYSPPDISQGVGLILAARRARQQERTAEEQAATQRLYAENARADNQMKRESADMARRKFDEEMQRSRRQDEIENTAALLPTSPLMRAARNANSPELANALGKPYGVTFDRGFEGPDVNPGTGGHEAPPLGADLPPASRPIPPPAEHPPGTLAPAFVDQVENGRADVMFGEDVENVPGLGGHTPMRSGQFIPVEGPMPPEAPPDGDPPLSQGTPAAPAPTPLSVARKMYANFGGNRFEVPEQQQGTGLGEKYDAVYRQILDRTGDEGKAYQAVLTMREKDDAAQAAVDRAATAATSRSDIANKFHLTAQTQEDLRREGLNVSERNNKRSAAARVASAGAGASTPGLAELIAMKESGASTSEIAAAAVELKVPPKVWAPLVRESGKETEKHTQLTVTGANGEVLGEAHNAVDKRKLDDANIAFAQLVERTKALANDARQYGARLLSPEAIQRRESLQAAAAAAGRKYHELGVSNANIDLEHKILGPSGTPGHGFIMGANPDIIEQTLEEATKKHDAAMRVRLRSGQTGDRVAPQMRPKQHAASSVPPQVIQQARAALADPHAPAALKAKAQAILQGAQ